MSAKTKIVVLHMKELIYTIIFASLGILLIILLICMFLPEKKEGENVETMRYTPGVYTSSIVFGEQSFDVQVTVDETEIQSVSLVNLDETITTMYPLMEETMESLSEQICKSQSLDEVSYTTDNQYTATVLLNAVEEALEKAEMGTTETEE
ncbi:MAG: hypothetical protein ACI4ES_00975 [Roseburia sp.]